jgi:hypothetical protein
MAIAAINNPGAGFPAGNAHFFINAVSVDLWTMRVGFSVALVADGAAKARAKKLRAALDAAEDEQLAWAANFQALDNAAKLESRIERGKGETSRQKAIQAARDELNALAPQPVRLTADGFIWLSPRIVRDHKIIRDDKSVDMAALYTHVQAAYFAERHQAKMA